MKKQINALVCCTWNIRRGLIKREIELIDLLKSENVDVIFLTETDTKSLSKEEDYCIQGYKTILPITDPKSGLVRIIGLVKEEHIPHIKIRLDLMSKEFPSIWFEYRADQNKKSTLLAGFYRVWTQDGEKVNQLERMKVFNDQIDSAFENNNNMIIFGDANLCANKWLSPDFGNKKVAKSLQRTLERCGLTIANVGATYQSDSIKPNGEVCVSALDHVYFSSELGRNLSIKSLKNSSTDHLPVICQIRSIPKILPYTRKITKRSLKNFTEEGWNESLANKDWSELENCNMVD